ncbi:cinnamyl alcohol dehydrogenase [Streptomyces sp. NPDC006476]|uniref:cinnamyl alcohol dehydrogenase n=1 Tax=Streptomyces sp. NPDC006476 TaxID=3157175 RepID=UPI0033BF6439
MNRRSVLRAGTGLLAGGAALALPSVARAAAAAEPTDGWTQTSFDYSWQKPWNLDLGDRHSYSGGVHRMWVYATDEPFEKGSSTDPSGTDGASFVQILRSVHPSGTPATDIMLNAYDTNGGTVRRYDGTVLRTGVYDTWFNVKIAHQASSGTGTVKVYFDNSLVLTVADRGPATRYFKNGVYNHGSGRAEARFRNLRYWTR